MLKNVVVVSFVMLLLVGLAGCPAQDNQNGNGATAPEDNTVLNYDDGTYRGVFIDRDEVQVNVQFALTGNTVDEISFRHLAYGGTDYRTSEDETIQAIYQQYVEAAEHLIGNDIRETLPDLYTPDFVEDVDGFSGATIRANKIISAVRDALNRGVYSQ
ncbi:FMN-binding protein [Dethiobacter alkaliphilus]|uniref:FMN-binding protein n=1 Tax=Dethiobacter alkaliphilus TaxID=427926 RepID=UPI0022266183|nr:FMN-binding protein [Dethiobacter alkaliphilus]MCW3489053.1 FMN-binding protein [Dethiobacter alkaliphilus]